MASSASATASRRSPAPRGPRTTSGCTSTARRAASRSRSRSTSRPIGRPRSSSRPAAIPRSRRHASAHLRGRRSRTPSRPSVRDRRPRWPAGAGAAGRRGREPARDRALSPRPSRPRPVGEPREPAARASMGADRGRRRLIAWPSASRCAVVAAGRLLGAGEPRPGAAGAALRRGGRGGRHRAPLRRRVHLLRRRRRGGARLRRRRPPGPLPRRRRRAGGAVPEREPGRRRAGLRAGAVPDDRPDDVTGAYPLDIDGDGIVDLAVLRVGENVLLRGLGDCALRARERGVGLRWRRRRGPPPSARPGRTTMRCRRWPSATTSCSTTVDDASYVCDDNALVRPDATAAYAAPIPLSPGYVHAVDAVQRLGPIRPPRPARLERPPLLPSTGEEQLWRDRCRAQPRGCGRREEGWQPLRIWGMGIASYDLTGDGYPEVYLTSQADNKLQTLADGPARPQYERHRHRARRDRARAVRRRHRRCPRPPGTPSSRT